MTKEIQSPTKLEIIKAIIQLPLMVTIVIPLLIWYLSKNESIIPFYKIPQAFSLSIGGVILIAGLVLFYKSITLFANVGKGTLTPWNPTKKIVVKGLYCYVRNPMILSVILILLSESILFRMGQLLIYAIIFFLINHIFFVFNEEPALRKRFGVEYVEYCKNVPRWIPRIKGWKPELEQNKTAHT